MKKIKLFFMALLSLLLPSCTSKQTPNTSNDNNSIRDNFEAHQRVPTQNLENNSTRLSAESVKLPVGDENSMLSPSNPLAESSEDKAEITGTITENTVEETTKEAEIKKKENKTDSTRNQAEKKQNTTDISPSRELLGSFRTKVYTKTTDRQKNLRIVCQKLSGTTLAPNEEFSYNATCGPFNKENGFGKATIFVGKQEKQDYGGGVCQLSSTLYNAVKDLNVEITERHQHSKKVYYVPDGQDATVSYGNLDFKFKNLNNYSLYFEANSDADAVRVNVYKA